MQEYWQNYIGGAFPEPTVLDRVSPDLTIAREEVFGPDLSANQDTVTKRAARRFGTTFRPRTLL